MTQIDARVASRSRDPLTYDIIGAAMETHRRLGPGLPEAVYQEALALEFDLKAVPFEREAQLEIIYREGILRHRFRADFLVAGCVVVELKALATTGYLEQAQVLTYLRVGRHKKGLLLNFGQARLEYQRFVA